MCNSTVELIAELRKDIPSKAREAAGAIEFDEEDTVLKGRVDCGVRHGDVRPFSRPAA